MVSIVKVYDSGSEKINVEFRIIDGEIYAKANTMTENKKVENWKASPNTKRYLEAIENKNSLKTREFVISEEGRNGGTWIHEKLILSLKGVDCCKECNLY